MERQMIVETDRQTDRQTDGKTDRHMGGQECRSLKDEEIDGQREGQEDRHMTEGRTGRQAYGQTEQTQDS